MSDSLKDFRVSECRYYNDCFEGCSLSEFAFAMDLHFNKESSDKKFTIGEYENTQKTISDPSN